MLNEIATTEDKIITYRMLFVTYIMSNCNMQNAKLQHVQVQIVTCTQTNRNIHNISFVIYNTTVPH